MDQEIVKGLEPLFDRAEREGLWFYCSYQGLWLSPDELKAEQARGNFRWGAVNWEIRDPAEGISYLERTIEKYQTDLECFKKRLAAQKKEG